MTYQIADFCTIRNNTISHGGKLIFRGKELLPVPFFTEAYKHFEFNYSRFYKMDNLCKLGFLASEILMNGVNRNFSGDDFGLILGNSASSVDTDRTHQQAINDRNAYFPSPSVFVYTLPNIVIGEICIKHKLFGESAFFINEKFDAAALYSYVKILFDENVMRQCLAGWIEFDRDKYECLLLRIEKCPAQTEGINIFDAGIIKEIYSQ